MNGFTLLSFRLLALAGVVAFFLWQFARQGLDLGSAGSMATWLVCGLFSLGFAASVAGAFDESRLSRSTAVALVSNGFGAVLAFLHT